MRARLVIGLVAIAALLAATAAVGIAIPNPPQNVPLHNHFKGDVQVGPDICADPDNQGLRRAFLQFHFNVHLNAPGLQDPRQIRAEFCE